MDAEAIGTWILDVYLKARIEGKSDAEARQSITDAIKGSDEWRRKHPRTGQMKAAGHDASCQGGRIE